MYSVYIVWAVAMHTSAVDITAGRSPVSSHTFRPPGYANGHIRIDTTHNIFMNQMIWYELDKRCTPYLQSSLCYKYGVNFLSRYEQLQYSPNSVGLLHSHRLNA